MPRRSSWALRRWMISQNYEISSGFSVALALAKRSGLCLPPLRKRKPSLPSNTRSLLMMCTYLVNV